MCIREQVCDSFGACVDSELTIDVIDSTANPDNTPPVAANDHFETFSDPLTPATLTSDLFGNDGDPDGDVIEVLNAGGVATGTPFTTANGGTVVVNPDGSFDYTPAAGFIGVDSFDYVITDPSGETDDATVSINVQPDSDPSANDAPDANDDAAIAQKNTQATGNVLDNDTDPNNDPLTVTEIDGVAVTSGAPAVVTTPNGGTVEIFENGSYFYTPANDFIGTESVIYTISDGNGGTDTATLILSVNDNPPVAQDDINATETDIPVSGNVLTNDTDPNPNDDLMVVDPSTGLAAAGAVTITTTSGGTVVVNPDGSYEYTPASGFSGEDTFEYTVADENGNTDTATVSIEVRDLNGPIDPSDPSTIDNAPPIATDDEFTSLADVPLSLIHISEPTRPY